MWILQSIKNQAGAVWQTETLAMPLRHADKVIKQRIANASGVRRFRLVKV
tara:strand:+ start:46 stop:195 length:150 start_codon:yes stop_codon:yes gene_type:complete